MRADTPVLRCIATHVAQRPHGKPPTTVQEGEVACVSRAGASGAYAHLLRRPMPESSIWLYPECWEETGVTFGERMEPFMRMLDNLSAHLERQSGAEIR